MSGLRVLAVAADKPYAQPGDTVTFTMTYSNPEGVAAPQILWLGPCINPPGDAYYGCYSQLAAATIGLGSTFTVTLPADILPPGQAEGTAFVFFAACDGTVGALDGGAGGGAGGGGAAGSFPLGCFGPDGQALSAAAFVPGYTQVSSFADERIVNHDPVVQGLSVNQDSARRGQDVTACPVPEGARIGVAGCGTTNPFTACSADGAEYQITVEVPSDVAEIDYTQKAPDGSYLHEIVWVDYFADQGDIDSPTVLVSDATLGYQPSHGANWIAPPAPDSGTLPVNLWAVVRDSRGGVTVAHQVVDVQAPQAP